MRRSGWVLAIVLVACGGPAEPVIDAAASVCASDLECDDGVFCNGAEACRPEAAAEGGNGCFPGVPPCDADSCDEPGARCRASCEVAGDADGDGVRSIECGGNDCDDDDPSRYPGATEICDTGHVDEDCDPVTFGVRDADGDGHPDARCCNGDACGGDCDDTRSGVHPDATETCNGTDDDCDGLVDEGVLREFRPDLDGDGYGDAEAEPVMGCNPPLSHVENALDCDDDERAVNPATSELCDGLDNDCDGRIDEAGTRTFYRDRDEDGFGDPSDVRSLDDCVPPDGYVAIGTDCNDADATQRPGAPEVCNRRDDDCSQPGVDRGGVDASEDLDQDGHAPVGAGCEGGLPRDDCDDTRAATYPGAYELCNDVDDDCDGTRDEGADGFCGGQAVCEVGVCVASDRLAVDDGLSCLRTGGVVDCWSPSGRVRGDGAPTTPRASLGRVSGLTDARQIAVFADDYGIEDDSATWSQFACAVRATGRVVCWGSKQPTHGGLGDGSTMPSSTPVEVAGLTDAVEVALGLGFACARRRTGAVVCWGSNDTGQLGDGTTTTRTTPVAVLGITDAVELAVGRRHACVRLRDGTARCWGYNPDGQLGDGGPTGDFGPNPTPRAVVTSSTIDRIVAGSDYTCVLIGGQVQCAGDGDAVGSSTDSSTLRPARDVPGGVVWLESAESPGICAGTATGQTYCWGLLRDRTPLCGHGVRSASPGDLPCAVAPTPHLGAFDELSMGTFVACVREAESLRCWGANTRTDRFGDGGTARPSTVVGLAGGVQAHGVGCAVDDAGRFHRWGSIDPSGAGTSVPVAVPELDGATECLVESGAGVVAVVAGAVRRLPFADEAPGPIETLPLTGATATRLRASGSILWALLSDGSVRRWWGSNAEPLGPFESVSGATDLSVGMLSTCVVIDEALWCSGSSRLAGVTLTTMTLAEIPGTGAVRRVATFSGFNSAGAPVCVLRADGTVACGTEAPPSAGTSTPFAAVAGIEDAVGIAVRRDVACALLANGTVRCWGEGPNGELGQPVPSSAVPIAVEGLTDATSIVTGGEGTFCAESASRGLVCWGDDSYGWLGRGVTRPVTLLP